MAIEQGEETITVMTTERTWRTELESPLNQMPSVVAHRETVRTVGAEVISKTTGIQVRRSFADIATQMLDFNPSQPGKITGAEMAGLISQWVDIWRQEDIDAAAAATVAG